MSAVSNKPREPAKSEPGDDVAATIAGPRRELRDNASPVREGDLVAGKYRVEEIVGIGGMGVIVAATHLGLEQRVALKFLLPGGQRDQEVVARFMREARAAVKIQSEHVGRVYDVAALESGEPYIVMEYLEGRDLSGVLLSGKLPVAKAVEHVLQACEAIAEAHAYGIVHRDLKPANLFLAKRVDGSSVVKVLDFGISKAKLARAEGGADATDPAITNPTSVMGSPLYMSPEQMRSSMHVDVRTDIWAIGVILYEMVTGTTPFEAESVPLIHAAIVHEDPPPMRLKLPTVRPDFERVVRKCLAKDPEARYADIAELVTALAPYSPKQGRVTLERVSRLARAVRASERPGPPEKNAALGSATSETSQTITNWGESRKRAAGSARKVLAIGVVVGALGLAALAASVLRGGPATGTAAATATAPATATATASGAATATAAETASASAPEAQEPADSEPKGKTRKPRTTRPATRVEPTAAPAATVAPTTPPAEPPATGAPVGTSGFGDRK